MSANNILERKRIDKHGKCVHRWSSAKKTSKITGKIAINVWREETTPKEGLSVYECVSVCDRVQNIITTQQWKIATAKKVSQNKGKKPNKKRRSHLSYKTPNRAANKKPKKYQKVINSQNEGVSLTKQKKRKKRWSFAQLRKISRAEPRIHIPAGGDPSFTPASRKTGSSASGSVTICWISREWACRRPHPEWIIYEEHSNLQTGTQHY